MNLLTDCFLNNLNEDIYENSNIKLNYSHDGYRMRR